MVGISNFLLTVENGSLTLKYIMLLRSYFVPKGLLSFKTKCAVLFEVAFKVATSSIGSVLSSCFD